MKVNATGARLLARGALVALIVVLHFIPANPLAAEDNNKLNLSGQMMTLGSWESVKDPWRNSERLYLFLRQARLSVEGRHANADFRISWMMGGEEVPESNSVMSLLDAYVHLPLAGGLFELRFGQFKVPYSRERLLDSGSLLNTDRSIQQNFFNIGRDVGVAVHSSRDKYSGALGIFTAGGINIPERYLPQDLGIPMLVARFGVSNGLDTDAFTPFNHDRTRHGVAFAGYINAAYTKDSIVGHSTPLRVKYYDKSLILHDGWNPYIRRRGAKADLMQVGSDIALEVPVTERSDVRLVAELNYADFRNDAGQMKISGGVVGAYVLNRQLAIGLRYAQVRPDAAMAYTWTDQEDQPRTYPIRAKKIHEITPSIVCHMPDYGLKIIADLGLQLNVPVSLEQGVGVYNLMRQPDQVRYAASGGIERQNNILGNLILQFNF